MFIVLYKNTSKAGKKVDDNFIAEKEIDKKAMT
jgi:hypothetical protein